MAKKKVFIGLFRDGSEYKAAQIIKEKNEIYIEALYKSDSYEIKEEKQVESNTDPDSDFLSTFDFEEESSPKDEKPTLTEELKETLGEDALFDGHVSNIQKLKNFIENNKLYEGFISLNIDIANVKYFPFDIDSKTKKKKLIQAIENQIIEELSNNSDRTNSYFINNENQTVAISYDNNLDLLEEIISTGSFFPKRDYKFSSIQSIEISLINAIRYNYDLFNSGLVAIFYIGKDFSRIILMKGNSFYNALPIINADSNSSEIISTMYSRYLLERSQTADLPELEQIFIAGKKISEEWKEYLKEQDEELEIVQLTPRMLKPETSDITDEKLTEFIIPIMLATESAEPKNDSLIHTNFIPKSILEQQNKFSIGVAGVIILFLLFVASYFGLKNYIYLSFENNKVKSNIKIVKNNIEYSKTIIDSIKNMEMEISKLENNIKRVKKIIGNKNQWHFILEEISNSYVENSLSWATNLKKQDDNIKLQGTTTVRKNIVAFSQLFPKGQIEKINKRKLENYTLWDYDILYNMPDPTITRRLDFEREGIFYGRDKSKKEKAKKIKNIKKKKINNKKIVVNEKKLYQEALSYYRKKHLDKAMVKFKEYIQTHEDLYVINSKYFIAEILYRKNDLENAKTNLKEIIKINKRKVPESLIILGNIAREQNENKLALEYWQELINKFPKSRLTTIARKKIDNIGKI